MPRYLIKVNFYITKRISNYQVTYLFITYLNYVQFSAKKFFHSEFIQKSHFGLITKVNTSVPTILFDNMKKEIEIIYTNTNTVCCIHSNLQ